MKNFISASLTTLVFLLAAGVANAQTTTNIVVTPTSPIFDSNNVDGVPFDAAPGYASGSFASNGDAKTDMYFTPDALFLRSVTLGEVLTMSYWTKTGGTHEVNPADWFIAIYTKPYSGDCSSGSWYGDRIGTEPYFSININDPADTWNEWSTNGAENQLRFFESTSGCAGATFGSYTDPDWDTFVGGDSLSGGPYLDHEILYLSIQTGSAWAGGFTGQLDGFKIELTDGSVATINFESPTPPLYPDECKKDGWQVFTRTDGSVFNNQGDCIQFVSIGK